MGSRIMRDVFLSNFVMIVNMTNIWGLINPVCWSFWEGYAICERFHALCHGWQKIGVDMMSTTLGERLILVRGDLSQAAFARRMQVSKTSVGNWERGDRIPDADFLQKLVQDGFNSNWILTGAGAMREHQTRYRDRSPTFYVAAIIDLVNVMPEENQREILSRCEEKIESIKKNEEFEKLKQTVAALVEKTG